MCALIGRTHGAAHVATSAIKQFTSLHHRLESEAQRLREQARVLPPGVQRSDLLRRIEKFERAIGINCWLSSPGLEFTDTASAETALR